jgi:hypothetical protein
MEASEAFTVDCAVASRVGVGVLTGVSLTPGMVGAGVFDWQAARNRIPISRIAPFRKDSQAANSKPCLRKPNIVIDHITSQVVPQIWRIHRAIALSQLPLQ